MTILTGEIFYEPDAIDIAETIRRSEGREIDDAWRLCEPSQRFELTPLGRDDTGFVSGGDLTGTKKCNSCKAARSSEPASAVAAVAS